MRNIKRKTDLHRKTKGDKGMSEKGAVNKKKK